MNRKKFASFGLILAFAITAIFASLTQEPNASAGPEIIGNPNGAEYSAIISSGETVKKIMYFAAGVKTMANTTPVSSGPKCGMFGDLHSAEVRLVGTMGGTNPTLTVLWRNSKDGGLTWNNVGTWTTINATVTPLVQSQTVADLAASTAVAFGDCWDATYTFGGTGTVTANIQIYGLEK